MTQPLIVELYTRPGCGLCDTAQATLAPLLRAFDATLRLVDISRDPALEARYKLRIPVITIDGEEAFTYRVDRDRAEALLRAARARLDGEDVTPGSAS